MGILLRDLMREPEWEDLHDSADAAADSRRATERVCDALTHVVDASIRRTLESAEGEERMWAEISRADLLFLTEPEPADGAPSRRVNLAYRAAVSADHAFALEPRSANSRCSTIWAFVHVRRRLRSRRSGFQHRPLLSTIGTDP